MMIQKHYAWELFTYVNLRKQTTPKGTIVKTQLYGIPCQLTSGLRVVDVFRYSCKT